MFGVFSLLFLTYAIPVAGKSCVFSIQLEAFQKPSDFGLFVDGKPVSFSTQVVGDQNYRNYIMVNQHECKQFMIVGSSQSLQYGMYGLVSDEWVFHADKTISFQVPVVLRSCTIFNASSRYATSYSVSNDKIGSYTRKTGCTDRDTEAECLKPHLASDCEQIVSSGGNYNRNYFTKTKQRIYWRV